MYVEYESIICVKARQNMTFGLSYEKNEAVLTAC